MNYLPLPPVFGLALAAAVALFTSCEDAVTAEPATPDAARIEVRLVDAPGDYEKVLIDVVDVQLRATGGSFTAPNEDFAGTYDLLELTAGRYAVLATTDFPAGELDEVRLLLGDDNFVQINGQLRELRTPSAQQSGLKVKISGDPLVAGLSYVLTLDFDAGRSVVRAGNSGNYNLKPVIRAELRTVDAVTGGISGRLVPAGVAYVYAFAPGGDSIGTYATATGDFLLPALPAGSYTVIVEPATATGLASRTLTDVVVTDGSLTDLGTVVLTE